MMTQTFDEHSVDKRGIFYQKGLTLGGNLTKATSADVLFYPYKAGTKTTKKETRAILADFEAVFIIPALKDDVRLFHWISCASTPLSACV